jgi:predicted  nucleic acid-binding Zn-ribbon protein
MQPSLDPATLAETLAQELTRLGTAVRHIQAAEQAATQAVEAANQVIVSQQTQNQQHTTQLTELTQELGRLTTQLQALEPKLAAIQQLSTTGSQPLAIPAPATKPLLAVAAGLVLLQLAIAFGVVGRR